MMVVMVAAMTTVIRFEPRREAQSNHGGGGSRDGGGDTRDESIGANSGERERSDAVAPSVTTERRKKTPGERDPNAAEDKTKYGSGDLTASVLPAPPP